MFKQSSFYTFDLEPNKLYSEVITGLLFIHIENLRYWEEFLSLNAKWNIQAYKSVQL